MCIIEIPIIMHVRQYPNPFYGVTGLIIMVVSAALLVIGVVPQVSTKTILITISLGKERVSFSLLEIHP